MALLKKSLNRWFSGRNGHPSWLLAAMMLFIPVMNASAFNLVSIYNTDEGKYMRADNGGGEDIRFDRDNIKSHEKYTVVDLGGGEVALQCSDGHYLTAIWGGYYWLDPIYSGFTHCGGNSIGTNQKWKLEDIGGGEYAIKCRRGDYLRPSTSNSYGGRCTDNSVGSNNKYVIKEANPFNARIQPDDPGYADQKLGVDPGYDALMGGEFMRCGMPLAAFKGVVYSDLLQIVLDKLTADRGLADRVPMLEMFTNWPEFARPTGPGDCGNDVNNTFACAMDYENNTEVVNFTCLSCHASKVPGTDHYKIGLSNTNLDYGFFFNPTILKMLKLLMPPLLSPAVYNDADEGALDDFIATVGAFQPYIQAQSVGNNPAIQLGSLIWAFRDGKNPANNGQWDFSFDPESVSEDPQDPNYDPRKTLMPFQHVVSGDNTMPYREPPVDTPAWFTTFKGNPGRRTYHTGLNSFDPGSAFATLLCGDNYENHKDLESVEDFGQQITDILNYIATIESPVLEEYYPNNAVAQADIDAGKVLYDIECASCHGTYDANDPSLDSYTMGYYDVGTDDVIWQAQSNDEHGIPDQWKPNSIFWGIVYANSTSNPWTHVESEWDNGGFPAKFFQSVQGGYKAPYLRGVWATAPYLHNGSVPSLSQLFEVDTNRVDVWRRFNGITGLYKERDYIVSRGEAGWDFLDINSSLVDYHDNMAQALYITIPENNILDLAGTTRLDPRVWVYDTTNYGAGNEGHNYGTSLTASEKVQLIEYVKSL